MIVVHDSKSVPVYPERWEPDDIDRVWIAWDAKLNGATISQSTWTVPSGWTESAAQVSQSVSDADGNSYTAANSVLLATTQTSGSYVITNHVTLSDGREYDRSVRLVIKPL